MWTFTRAVRRAACMGAVFFLTLPGVAYAEEEAAMEEVAEEAAVHGVSTFKSPVGGRFIVLARDIRCAQTNKGEVFCMRKGRAARKVAGVRFPRKSKGFGESACFLDARGRVGCIGWFSELLTRAGMTEDELMAQEAFAAKVAKERKPTSPLVPTWRGSGASEFAMGMGYNEAHLCLVRGSNVQCTGFNDHGQLGDGTRTPRSHLAPVKSADGKKLWGVKSLSLTAVRSCAVKYSGELSCWGRNHPLDQARDYHGPKRYTVASRVPLSTSVAAMGERCLISASGQQYCWPIVGAKTGTVSYVPLARDRCGLKPREFTAECVLERRGKLNCERRGTRFTKSVPQDALVTVNYGKICIAEGTTVTCIRSFVKSKHLSALGFEPAKPTPSSCQGESPTAAPPAFPAHAFVKVTATKLEGAFGRLEGPSIAVSRHQFEKLSEIASSPKTYTNSATCHDPDLAFRYIDAEGEVIASMSGGGCSTLEISPGAPARLFGSGNVITPWARKKMGAIQDSIVWN